MDAQSVPNGDTSQFSMEMEIRVTPCSLKWHMLDRALEMGQMAEEAHSRAPPRLGGPTETAQAGRTAEGQGSSRSFVCAYSLIRPFLSLSYLSLPMSSHLLFFFFGFAFLEKFENSSSLW